MRRKIEGASDKVPEFDRSPGLLKLPSETQETQETTARLLPYGTKALPAFGNSVTGSRGRGFYSENNQ
jgi:hypothetical protein